MLDDEAQLLARLPDVPWPSRGAPLAAILLRAKQFTAKGLEALADLQIEEDAAAGGYPSTKMHQKFAGMNRWLILESVLSQRT